MVPKQNRIVPGICPVSVSRMANNFIDKSKIDILTFSPDELQHDLTFVRLSFQTTSYPLSLLEVGDLHFNLDKYWPISLTAHTHKFSLRVMKGRGHEGFA